MAKKPQHCICMMSLGFLKAPVGFTGLTTCWRQPTVLNKDCGETQRSCFVLLAWYLHPLTNQHHQTCWSQVLTRWLLQDLCLHRRSLGRLVSRCRSSYKARSSCRIDTNQNHNSGRNNRGNHCCNSTACSYHVELYTHRRHRSVM